MVPNGDVLAAVGWQFEMLRTNPSVQHVESIVECLIFQTIVREEAEEAIVQFRGQELFNALKRVVELLVGAALPQWMLVTNRLHQTSNEIIVFGTNVVELDFRLGRRGCDAGMLRQPIR